MVCSSIRYVTFIPCVDENATEPAADDWDCAGTVSPYNPEPGFAGEDFSRRPDAECSVVHVFLPPARRPQKRSPSHLRQLTRYKSRLVRPLHHAPVSSAAVFAGSATASAASSTTAVSATGLYSAPVGAMVQTSACDRSAIRSSGCSRPIDTRSRLTGVADVGPSTLARCSIRLSTPPKLVALVNSFSLPIN
jgi:hypothetical protein